jgi:hypothetical protein
MRGASRILHEQWRAERAVEPPLGRWFRLWSHGLIAQADRHAECGGRCSFSLRWPFGMPGLRSDLSYEIGDDIILVMTSMDAQ